MPRFGRVMPSIALFYGSNAMKLSISAIVTVSGVALATGITLTLMMGAYALNTLKVNGPIYQEIVDSKDLIADILPPPLYLIETYALTNEGALDAGRVAKNIERIKVLKGQYQERREYWKTTTLPDTLKQKLQNDVLIKGDAFWSLLESDTLPALLSKDPAKIMASLPALSAKFHAHEDAVNELVEMGTVYGKQKEVEAAGQTSFLQNTNYTLGGLLIVLSIAATIFLRRRAIAPINQITQSMTRMANGDLNEAPPHLQRQDEIGAMARALAVFRDAGLAKCQLEEEAEQARITTAEEREAREQERLAEADALRFAIEQLGRGLNNLSNCDLRFTLDSRFDAKFERLRGDFNATVTRLQTTLGTIMHEADQLRQQGQEMNGAANDLSRRTEQQAAALEETAAALEEVATTVKTATARVNDTRDLVKEARRSTSQSSDVVNEAILAMQRIETAATEIKTIVSTIDEIAFQTNLLALNAGVEAARAGEAGKGFAVVAQEVRELAQRSAHAAKEIRGLIGKSGEQVESGVKLVQSTGNALTQIEDYVCRIDTNVDSIATGAREQAVGLQEISTSVNTLDQMTQRNAAMVEETSAVSQTIAHSTLSLSAMVGQFQLKPENIARHAA